MEIKINEPWITDKVRIQNGYAYIDHPFWNAEKQQADHKREYIGKYDGPDLYRQTFVFDSSMKPHTCLTGLLKRQASPVILESATAHWHHRYSP